jgi:hypothetical protein
MATEVYKRNRVVFLNGIEIETIPLKIKYLREFMDAFEKIKGVKNDDGAIQILSECAFICMKQYYPELSNNIKDFEDNVDLPTIYNIIDSAAGIKIDKKSDEAVKDQATSKGATWKELDLVKLEAEAFLLGIWKDYEELETSLSMPELMATLASKRELDYEEKKFLAAIQGINLDEQSKDGKKRGQQEWEDLKARVFSKGKTSDGNDVLALQGPNAKKAGFGIGLGLDYDDMRDPSVMKS